MNINIKYATIIFGAILLCAGCASTREQAAIRVEPVATLLPDREGTVQVDVNFIVPAEALHRRSRIIIMPQWTDKGKVYAEYRPVVLDAPIYTRKMNRREKLYDYCDTLKEQSQQITMGRDWTIPYQEQVEIPAEAQGGRLVAMLSTDGCGTCSLIDTIDMAYLTTLPQLIDPSAVKLDWIERDFAIRPGIMQAKGEALLQFAINRHDINLQLGNNRREMRDMLDTLQRITGDTLATLQGVAIYGMASADGPLAFNSALASRRANSAKQWLLQQLQLPASIVKQFKVDARPEGWGPVMEAMRTDGHTDTLQISRLLERYAGESDDKAEYFIRRLPCWNDIKKRYLQKDRKVVYEYSYSLKSGKDDRELLQMYRTRPDAFNEEELLHIAMLQTDAKAQEEVYRTTLQYFPLSTTAVHNLSVLLMRRGAATEAEALLKDAEAAAIEKGSKPTAEIRRALAAAFLQTGHYEEVIGCVDPETDGAEARYHVGLAHAKLQRYAEAFRYLREFNDCNAALVSLCAGEDEHAWQQMQTCSDQSPRAAYIRALTAARRGDKSTMMQQLRLAVEEPQWATRAAGESEFRAYWNDVEFQALVKGGIR